MKSVEYVKLTPRGIAMMVAVDSGAAKRLGVNPETGVTEYDGTEIMRFFDVFSEQLAEQYGFKKPDDVWKTMIENSPKYRAENRKKNFKKHP